MNVKQVKETMRDWVADNVDQYPGLQFANLVGSITKMDDETPFPAEKDVDMHLVFAPNSPALAPNGPYSTNLEFMHEGLMVEVGLKPVSEYQDAETILANPEIAYHMTRDSVLYDPQGRLTAMMPTVKAEFNRRQWVLARIEQERRGWDFIRKLYHQIPDSSGMMRVSLIGYSFTRLSCVLCDVTLQSPKVSNWKMRQILGEYGRCDLYDAHLSLLGLDKATPELAQHYIRKATTAFDLAVRIRKTPHPFQHKLHAHLRPYFLGKFQTAFDAGNITEAVAFIFPFYLSSCDVIITDGNSQQQAQYKQERDEFLETFGLKGIAVQKEKWAESRKVGEAIFDLAHEIALENPQIVD